jgi:hypothetical protein
LNKDNLMYRNLVVMGCALGFGASLAAETVIPLPALTATQIVDRNVAARGGLQAWRAVKTISLAGKLGAGGNQRATLQTDEQVALARRKGGAPAMPSRPAQEAQLPFLMELERPRKMRFELQFAGQTAIQVYDGAHGWKLRPYLNRRVIELFTDDELKVSAAQADLDGPLVDYAAKGTRVELAGTDKVEGHDTYKIKMTIQSGQVLHVWIDAQTFLEAKIEGQPRRMDGTDHPTEVYFRDYRPVEGLQIPFVLETRVLPVTKTATGLRDVPVPPERISIEKVVLNPRFDEALFAKPDADLSASVR